MEFLLSGLILGFLTSFHCVGMCGPIAIALPLNGNSKLQKLYGVFWNNQKDKYYSEKRIYVNH